jgi:hypothetical protein
MVPKFLTSSGASMTTMRFLQRCARTLSARARSDGLDFLRFPYLLSVKTVAR